MSKMTDQEARRLREGGVLVFAWGPPWSWLPSFQRSRHHATSWSLTWFWWGLTYYPVSMATLAIDGAFPRCVACGQHAMDIEEVSGRGGMLDLRPLCGACQKAGIDPRRALPLDLMAVPSRHDPGCHGRQIT